MTPTGGTSLPSSPILVVDDDPAVRGLIAETLLADGYAVVEAEGGDHALRLLATDTFAAVLLDRTMPGLDGIEVLHWIRRTAATALLPVILVTGRDEPTDVVEGLDLGADDYLVKPFEPAELIARIRRHIHGRREWSLLVEREVDRRRALTETARSTGAAGPVDQAAMQLCDGLIQLPEAAGAMVAEIIGDGVVPIASKGSDPLLVLTRHDERSVGQRLANRSRQGAWLEPAVERGTDQATAIAVAPITVDGAPVALVLVTPEHGLARDALDRLLAVAIDFAALAAGMLGTQLRDTAAKDAARQRFVSLVERHDFATVYQPVVDLDAGTAVGYEALTRFDPSEPLRATDTEAIFTGAALVGAGRVVELRTLEAAIEEASVLPDGVWLSVNASPSLIVARSGLAELVAELGGRPLVIEVSELEPVDDYAELRTAIEQLGTQVQLSIDDAGSGYATLSHVLSLGADFIKIDQSWVRDIDTDPGKRALVSGIQNFASETGATVVAEGIETEAELATIRRLGIDLGQGFLLGHPTTTADL